MSSRQRKVLVLGDDTRSFLAVARSLGRKGLAVHAAPFNFRAPALESRYVGAIHRLPLYAGEGSEWCSATKELLERQRFDLVIPLDERTLLPFHRFRSILEPLCRIAIPSQRAIEALYDKHATRLLAERCRVAIPRGRLLRDDDTGGTVEHEFGSSLALKPRRSYRLSSLHQRGQVRLVSSREQLDRALHEIEARSDYLVESFFDGRGLGVSVLAADGRVVYGFEHHRVRESGAGGSYLRVSAPLHPERLAACERMLKELAYTGVAMFEFRQNPSTGDWALLEVNARFWGSLPLPVGLGVDFPHDLYRLLVEQAPPPERSYRDSVYARNLIGDLHTTAAHESERTPRITRALAFLASLLAALPRILSGRERSDTFVRDDPKPGFAELAALLGSQLSPPLARLRGWLGGITGGRRRRIARALRSWTPDRRLVFLCQGNICRSPFAQHLLQQQARTDLGRRRISSAGLLPLPGRSSPDEALRAAREFGVDLQPHRSILLDDSMLSDAALIFVFDRQTREDYRDRHPDATVPVFLLGDFLPQPHSIEIQDPYGGSPETFQQVYARIDRAVGELLRLLDRSLDRDRTRS